MCFFSIDKWLAKYAGILQGKRVVLFGATGGIGNVLSSYFLQLGCDLVTVDRNPQRAELLRMKLSSAFPDAKICSLIADLSDMDDVNRICEELKQIGVDILIHNAGAYSIPRKICNSGFDNVFQINFLSPYYITRELLPQLASRKGKVIVVGSIAHNYSKSDPNDVDFRGRDRASLAYGNAKRFWMYSAFKLAEKNPDVQFAVTHPGITFTNITAHYPKWLFRIIKYPMKVFFMPPKRAALSIVLGVFKNTPAGFWIGPRLFHIWGAPAVKKLNTANITEKEFIANTAEQIYKQMQRR